MKKIIQHITGIILLLMVASCNQQTGKSTGPKPGTVSQDSVQVQKDKVELTQEQLKTAEITMGSLVKRKMGSEISVNGSTELKPNYFASVSPPANGYVYRVDVQEGDEVTKGAVLAILEHPDYIQLQQDFLEASGKFDYLKKELERQKTLSEANVSAKKNYQQTQSDYEMARAQYFASRERLQFLGISPNNVQAGNIQHRITLRAPIGGVVSRINYHKGELVNPQKTLFELIDTRHLFIKLKIFEKSINQIKKGENFTFSVPAFNKPTTYSGTITGISRSMDPQSKMMEATGTIAENSELVPGLYIEAKVQAPETETMALPDTAIVRDKDAEYLFIAQGTQVETSGEKTTAFKKVKVLTGVKEDGFTEITNADDLGDTDKIVLSGAYYLKAELNKGEGDDD